MPGCYKMQVNKINFVVLLAHIKSFTRNNNCALKICKQIQTEKKFSLSSQIWEVIKIKS